jgi:hypothetical protein
LPHPKADALIKIEEGKTPYLNQDGWLPLFDRELSRESLFLFSRYNGFHGTLIGTTPAISTKLGINNIFLFSFADCFSGTFTFASTTGNAFICNYVRHFIFSLSLLFNGSLISPTAPLQ